MSEPARGGRRGGSGDEPHGRWIFGIQPAREAIEVHGAQLLRVLVEERPREAQQLEAVARFARDRGAHVERVDRAALDRIAHGERHQGVAIEAAPLRLLDETALLEGRAGAPPLVIALDELTDPQNFGAIVRSAVALGASAVAWPEDRSAPLSAAMTRASAGAVEHARLCRVTSLPRLLGTLADAGLSVIGLDAGATDHLHVLELDKPLCLVVGAEGKGLRNATKQRCTAIAKLPMPGPIASLNASVAAAIAIYEVVRARTHASGERTR